MAINANNLAVPGWLKAFLGIGGEPDRPDFSHNTHVHKDRQLECTECHAGAKTEKNAGMPDGAGCKCHGTNVNDNYKPPEKRASSFKIAGEVKWQQYNKLSDEIKFSHATHAEKGVECRGCHGKVDESSSVTSAVKIMMQGCVDCHVEKGNGDDCETCHEDRRKETAPPTHAKSWPRRHGARVRLKSEKTEDSCTMCHTESSCFDCHSTTRPFNHNALWRNRTHAVAAAFDRENCSTCHDADGCIECHETTEPISHRGSSWNGGRGNRHCMSCHDSSSSTGCSTCHPGGGAVHETAAPLRSQKNPEQPPHPIINRPCSSCH